MASGGGGGAAARMDPEAATELVRKGSTLLLLDVPQRTLFGIDTQVFSVGPKFKGMKMVPPGPHFIYYCSSSRSGSEFAPTVGFFLTTQPTEVIVRKWDPQEERLIKLSEEEMGQSLEAFMQWKTLVCLLLSCSEAARKLKTLLETTFGWDLEDNAVNLIGEDDEFAPVVVEMDGL
nr:unnamed protein product [Digitaria exilis]